MGNKDSHRIEQLNEEIYRRDFKNRPLSPSQHFSAEETPAVERDWHHDVSPEAFSQYQAPKRIAGTFFKKILIFSILFFIISAGLLFYMVFGGWNIITANRVDIAFLGPVAVSAGNELDFDIVVSNQNRSPIENATLYIDYPDGTKKVEDITEDYIHDTETLGEILSGTTARRTSRSVQFGELNAKQSIKVTVEYGLKNSSAVYRKQKTYDVTISSTPLTLNVEHTQEAVSNDAVEYKATIVSNSSVPLTNVLLKADYLFGVAYIDADPKPTYDNNTWLIPTLNPGETKVITLHSQVQGEQGDERVVKFSIGAQSPQNEKEIATRYLLQTESVFLKKPPLALSVSVAGSSLPKIVTQQGAQMQGTIHIINNLPTQIVDAQIKITFDGKQLLDPASVYGNYGAFYHSIDHQLIWDKTAYDRLALLEPGAQVDLNFAFTTFPVSSVAQKNNSMSFRTDLTGNQVTDNTTQTISTSQTTTVVSQTSINLIPRAVYSVGPFRNRGPIPPKADTKTTYTIIWTAVNSLNDVRGAEVRANLPVNVTWLGVVNPQSESVTWNKDKNEVVWHIGDLLARAGSNKPAREAAFQVELTPSLSQVGSEAPLILNQTMTGIDSFTNTTLTITGKDLTTRMSTDPQSTGNDANVVR